MSESVEPNATPQTVSGSFRRNALLMLLGSAGAQGLTLLIMPAITRLFEPEAIGIQALFVSVSALLIVAATLRLDLAIVLPKKDDEAIRLVGLVFYQSLGLAAVIAVVGLVASDELTRAFAPEISSAAWLWMLAPMLVAGALTQSGIGIATRRGRFGAIVFANLAMSVTFASSAVLIGIFEPLDQGVVFARLLGQVASMSVLLALGLIAFRHALVSGPIRHARRQWRKQRQFLLFNTPYSLIGAFARDFPIYVFSLTGGTALVASYALARTVTLAPTTLASAALSSVFYREAALHLGTARLQHLAAVLTRWGLLASLPAFAFLFAWGDEMFSIAFGPSWSQAGEFAQRLAIPLWLALQTGWPERLFEAARRQKVSFTIQLGFDVLQATVIFVTFHLSNDPLLAVSFYAASYTAYQVTYLIAVYKVAHFELRGLLQTLVSASGLFALVAGSLVLARIILPFTPSVVLGASLVAALSINLLLVVIMYCKRSPAHENQSLPD